MNRVVITGLGAVTPIGNDIESFWNNLIAGNCGIDFITRFDTSDYKVKIAAEVKNFDPLLYMDKTQIRKNDLYSQYALASAAQAMEDSDLEGHIDPKRFGVFVGSGIGGMNTFVSESIKLYEKGANKVSPFFIPMMISNIAAGNIATRFNAQGPSLSIATACATSSHAIGEAFRCIQNGFADAMITGGGEASITGLAVAGFTNCQALTRSDNPLNASIPFDKRRDGFVMGEGGGILVLEEYEHAKKRGAKMYAEICGYGNTNDAFHMTAPQPAARGLTEAIRLAVEEGQINIKAPLYINAHGTSTPPNDKIETLAIKQALGEDAYKALVSSTKGMTGHMLGATGAAEAIACILALLKGMVPPTVGYKEPDEECDLDYVPNKARKVPVVYSLSTNLGFGGHNTCLAFKKVEE